MSSQDRLLAIIQKQHPEYHPVLAMVEIAMEQRRAGDSGDAALEFACHKEVAKYVVQVDKFVEVKQELKQTKRVVVELFAGQDHPARAIEAEVADVTDAIVKNEALAAVEDTDAGVGDAGRAAYELMRPPEDRRTDLLGVWGDGASASAASRFT